ncbi:hypothetical protein B0H14DRAFT_2613126 [Mycena olivaceomarginata]|nr:hypothetical protein B0H14DRAFT_2613126 [Mycena olivaceomarginata]
MSSSAKIDPNLIEIIGRFDIMDDSDPLDSSGGAGDDEDEEMEDETEIQEISELNLFSDTLRRAQEIAIARERENQSGNKRPHRYTGNSQRTKRRQAKINRDMAAKGFLSVGAFFTHVRNKISTRTPTPPEFAKEDDFTPVAASEQPEEIELEGQGTERQ